MFVKHAHVFLVLFGTIYLVSLSSAFITYTVPQRTGENEEASGNSLEPPKRIRNVFRKTDSPMGYLYMTEGPVHAEVITSPNAPQKISIRGNAVYLNGRLTVRDISRLSSRRTFQKRVDGSLWHTNLPMGTPMTDEEIQQFEKDADEKRRKYYEALNAYEKPGFTTTDPKGYLDIQVAAQVISPTVKQTLEFGPEGISVNNRLINRSRIGRSQTYQVGSDGARWYTNLPMGRAMTQEEIEQFQKDVQEREQNKRKQPEELDAVGIVEGIEDMLKQREEETKAAEEERWKKEKEEWEARRATGATRN